MGYYLIDKNNQNAFSHYVEKLEDIIYVVEGNLEDVIVSHGSIESKPFFLKDSEAFKHLCNEKFRLGLLAEELFLQKVKASNIKYMINKIAQDKESIENFKVIDSVSIKRADFEIKNCKDIEVEVKCLSYYMIENEDCFYIKYRELKSLERLNLLIAKDTVIAVFQQKENKIIEDSLSMIRLSTILSENNKTVKYDSNKKCLVVPKKLTTKGLTILEDALINKEAYSL
jgi:hypothetical protein